MSVDLKARREELGLMQAEVARKIGVCLSHYCNIENNKRGAGRKTLSKLAKVLGLEHKELDHLRAWSIPKEEWPTPEVITARPPTPNLVPGTIYKLKPKGVVTQGPKIASVAGTNPCDRVQKLRYLETQNGHHIFQSVDGGWLTSYTDVQLLGVCVNE